MIRVMVMTVKFRFTESRLRLKSVVLGSDNVIFFAIDFSKGNRGIWR